ncbi:MAG: hypothetical protein JST51_13175 [Armatimonadetes bacterium]|nr:hypothetical protein [Armatimonadota bacterium]
MMAGQIVNQALSFEFNIWQINPIERGKFGTVNVHCFPEIGELDYNYLSLAANEAADSIRCLPMTYGAKGIAFYAVMDTILLLYGMTVGAAYIEVYGGTKSSANNVGKDPTWRSIGKREIEQVKNWSKRPFHEFILSGHSFDDSKLAFRIRVFPLDREVEKTFDDYPNIISMLFGRRKVAEITFEAIRFLSGGVAGRKPKPLETLPNDDLYRELTLRVRYVIESQGEHVRLSDKRIGHQAMPLILLAQRTPVQRSVHGIGDYAYSYRYILAPQQWKALDEVSRVALESPLREPYKCRLDTTFESGSLTTHNRRPSEIGPRICGKMNLDRQQGIECLRKMLGLDQGCFQVYVPIHVKGTVAFVVVFQLPIDQRLDAFSVYANFIPAFGANLRQSVFETALSQAKSLRNFHEIVAQLCGERENAADGRLVRSEGVGAYDKIIKRRLEAQD